MLRYRVASENLCGTIRLPILRAAWIPCCCERFPLVKGKCEKAPQTWSAATRAGTTMNLKHGYVVLGVFLILIGTSMALYFFFEATPTVVVSYSAPQPSSACTVATATSTEANGITHRHYNVTCSLNISAIPANATLVAPGQSQLSNVTATISVVSTIGTVAVALTMLPLQGEERGKLKSGSAYSLVATSFLSLAVAIALFLILALPFKVIAVWLSLCLLLTMVAFTLVGYGFSMISLGMSKKK